MTQALKSLKGRRQEDLGIENGRFDKAGMAHKRALRIVANDYMGWTSANTRFTVAYG
jgi:hypothetical protein